MANFSLGHWLVVGFIVWLVYRMLRRSGSQAGASVSTTRLDGESTVNVVGESFYREHFEQLYPRSNSGTDREEQTRATLRLDDANPHDDQAVAVFIKEMQVGHLSRDDARRYRRAKGADRRDTLVSATVWVPGAPDYNYSVTLRLTL